MGVTILFAVALAWVLVEKLQVAYLLADWCNSDWWKRKPFTCCDCMAGWIALPVALFHVEWWQVPFVMALSMAASCLWNLFIRKCY